MDIFKINDDDDEHLIYKRRLVRVCVCLCVCVSRMDGQTACTIWTKFSELIAIYPTGNIGGSVYAPLSNKGSLPDGGT